MSVHTSTHTRDTKQSAGENHDGCPHNMSMQAPSNSSGLVCEAVTFFFLRIGRVHLTEVGVMDLKEVCLLTDN